MTLYGGWGSCRNHLALDSFLWAISGDIILYYPREEPTYDLIDLDNDRCTCIICVKHFEQKLTSFIMG